MLDRGRRWLLTLVVALAVGGCTSEPRLEFHTGSLSLPLRTRISDLEEGDRQYTLSIGETIVPGTEHPALRLGVAGGHRSIEIGVGDVEVFSVRSTRVDAIADDRENGSATRPAAYQFPLESGAPFDSIVVRVTDAEKDFSLVSAELVTRSFGVSFVPVIDFDTGVEIDLIRGNPHSEYLINFSTLIGTRGVRGAASDASGVTIRYRYGAAGAAPGELTLLATSDAGDTTSFAIYPEGGDGELHLHRAILGFLPATVRLVSHDPRFLLLGVELAQRSFDSTEPIQADFGAIRNYPESAWRDPRYEVFRWSRHPSILVFDTADYAIQASMLRRLAFFVEKLGFSGRVLTDDELGNRHGWNAHDYRAVDLAEFFSAADESVLTTEELELEGILVREGIIVPDDRGTGGYVAGAGGIISISRESTERLRTLFLRHEGYHGVFFAESGFREAAFDVWSELSDRERTFWREFLADRFYNTRDEYLMVNEFAAYLMQQDLSAVDAYFLDYSIPRFRIDSPDQVALIDAILADNPGFFRGSAERIIEHTRESAGLEVASNFCLLPLP